jgi:hypothetical protein
MAASRQVSEDHASPRSAVMPRIRMPASEKPRGKQDQRRAIGDADLAGDEGKAPEQAEQADIERERIEGGAGNRDRGRERHGKSPLPMI